jgi:hypothetical protein
MAKRIIKTDSRLKRGSEESRVDRHSATRKVKKNRKLSDSKRLDMFRKQFYQSSLPDLPKIKGYHVCWLTTTNPRDPIHGRMRLGYTPIKSSEIPGYDALKLTSGEHVGCIGVNEMVAFKLPLHLYKEYMREVHHTQPLEEEKKLRAAVDLANESLASQGLGRKTKVVEYDGNEELGRSRRPPNFAEEIGEE